ncbi:hypothetical protein MBLNU457_4646t1 [Dothideomycetes sp. NU457]
MYSSTQTQTVLLHPGDNGGYKDTIKDQRPSTLDRYDSGIGYVCKLDVPEQKTYGMSTFQALLQPILPTFWKRGGLKRHQKVSNSPTAYLDGLRGWAAFLVVFYHSGKADNRPWLQLPFIHILDAGHSCVTIFFVISGYVLTYRILKHARKQEPIAVLDTLASSIFKRWMRLYLPTALASLVVALAMQLGLLPNPPTARASNIFLQLAHWATDTVRASNPFAEVRGHWHPGVFRTAYLDQMWTIPVEFRGSMILFAYCVGVIKTPTKTRMALTVAAILATYLWGVVWIGTFLAGMLAADISLSLRPEHFSSTSLPKSQPLSDDGRVVPRTYTPREHAVYISSFVVAVFILSQPDVLGRPDEPAFWTFLASFIPASWAGGREYFYLLPGAFALILTIDLYTPLQKPLLHAFSQYLGAISFGLYAMHLPVIWAVEMRFVRPYCWNVLGDPLWAAVGSLVPLFVLVLCAAEQFDRLDRWCVGFVRRVQGAAFVEWEGRTGKLV